ncbi:neo-calmodulin-like [Symsagittifera roscoffensis]|uniref:neo-calmodulin-like n=1 Tax=Symsagittifera roscoffensis TaxID=84072 RepID=UPI00307C346B
MAAEGLSEEEVSEYQTAFSLFDEDGDGTITTKELGTIMRQLGMNPSEAELQEMVDEVDEDGNGEIDFDEFLSMMMKKMKETDHEEDYRQTFHKFADVHTGGYYVSTESLKKVLASMGERLTTEEVEQMMLMADTNKDGLLHYEEFRDFLASL